MQRPGKSQYQNIDMCDYLRADPGREKGVDKGSRMCYNTQALRECIYRGVEQLEARRAHNPEVVGSSPASATIKSPEITRFQDFFLRFDG